MFTKLTEDLTPLAVEFLVAEQLRFDPYVKLFGDGHKEVWGVMNDQKMKLFPSGGQLIVDVVENLVHDDWMISISQELAEENGLQYIAIGTKESDAKAKSRGKAAHVQPKPIESRDPILAIAYGKVFLHIRVGDKITMTEHDAEILSLISPAIV